MMIKITEEQRKVIMAELENDYHDKEMLVPQNNREYWLFTEIWQRLTDIFDKYDDCKPY